MKIKGVSISIWLLGLAVVGAGVLAFPRSKSQPAPSAASAITKQDDGPSFAEWVKFSLDRRSAWGARSAIKTYRDILDSKSSSRSSVVEAEASLLKYREEAPKREADLRKKAADMQARLPSDKADWFRKEIEKEAAVLEARDTQMGLVAKLSDAKFAAIYEPGKADKVPVVVAAQEEIAAHIDSLEMELTELRSSLSPGLVGISTDWKGLSKLREKAGIPVEQ